MVACFIVFTETVHCGGVKLLAGVIINFYAICTVAVSNSDMVPCRLCGSVVDCGYVLSFECER